jgi:hypothetical protein
VKLGISDRRAVTLLHEVWHLEAFARQVTCRAEAKRRWPGLNP